MIDVLQTNGVAVTCEAVKAGLPQQRTRGRAQAAGALGFFRGGRAHRARAARPAEAAGQRQPGGQAMSGQRLTTKEVPHDHDQWGRSRGPCGPGQAGGIARWS